MRIDEEKEYVLARYVKTKSGTKLGNQVVQDKLKLKSKLKAFLKANKCKTAQQKAE